MSFQDFIKPELLILVPVLYFVGMAIKKSSVRDNLIPFILGGIGVVIAAIYLLSTVDIIGVKGVFTAIFTALTQGILCAAASVYADQLIKQAGEGKKKEDK